MNNFFLVIITVFFLTTGCSTKNPPEKSEHNQTKIDIKQQKKVANTLKNNPIKKEHKIENTETNQTSSVADSLGDKVVDKSMNIVLNKMIGMVINSVF